PATHVWSLHPRDLLNPEDKSANVARGRMLLAMYLISDRPQRIEFHLPHHRPLTKWKLNGELLAFDDLSLQQTDTGVAHAELKAGPNLLLCRMPEMEHYWWASLSARVDSPVRLAASREGAASPTAWIAFGPFGTEADRAPAVRGIDPKGLDALHFLPEATVDRFESIWSAGEPSGADAAAAYARPLTPDMMATDDVYVRCASERVIAQQQPVVENVHALATESPEWTVIHPSTDADTRFLLDFGSEVVGFHEIELDAPAGTVIDVHNFEFIQPDGRFNLAEGMNNSFRYVCRAGWQRYRTLMRRGFRYTWLSVRNATGPVRIRSVRVLTSTYPQARSGSFVCSDPLLNQIWEVGARSVACCSEDTYTDCPSYEQTFWVGDGRNEAMVDLIINGDPRLSAHSLRLAGQSLDRSPIVESQVPSGWQNVLPAWSFLWMRWAQEHFEFTGDVAFAGEMLELIERNVAGIEQHLNADNLFQMRAWNMFDWAAMDTPPDGVITHLNCLAVLALRQVATMADAADRVDLSQHWTGLADRIAAATNRILWDDQRQAYIDCIRADGTRSPVFSQQMQTAAYIAGVATGDRAVRCGQIMHEAPEGFVTAGSPFFMFFLLEGLVREGKIDQLVRTILDYWGPQVEAGATTFWEMYTRDQPRMTRSHCHGWSAGPTYFLTQHVLGLAPASPGYERLRVAPHPGHVRWARGTVPTPRGTIHCSWQTDAHGTSVRVDAPYEMTIDVPKTGSRRIETIRGNAVSNTADTLVLRGTNIQFQITAAMPVE
ncbi:MAG: alpha-L-rhamnosidase, partial [Phycisphaerales bacterium]|nr:alpha-L-rhamnosidase [Phycisphaerales bacterium]